MSQHDAEFLEAYFEHLRRAGRTPATIRGRREILGRLDATLPYGVARATTEELAAWLYRDDWQQNTKATYYACLRSLYGWATNPRDPWLDHNPALDLEPARSRRGVPRPVTDEQLHRILTESPEPIRTWAMLAAYQGLRCIEVSRLDREHITEQTLLVVMGKGSRPRVHDTDPYVWSAVRDLPPGPVARRCDGRRQGTNNVSAKAARFFRNRLDMPGVSMHRLRHWMGVNIQRTYKDIRVTQEALGHASLQSTQIYTMATAEQQREARATLPRLAG